MANPVRGFADRGKMGAGGSKLTEAAGGETVLDRAASGHSFL
jgi:hypothetical protein